ncbi:MAG: 3-methyl-2-oxobutanoate hydroxymethyltransferase [Spirochaetes bacterium]|nr:3-methyl-2-oxobutanoate hydroxymethyltransferase [Spirochaetota bacterium]
MKTKTINDFIEMKKSNEKISVLTCYDYSFARIIDKSSIDMILVGDSAGMVFAGYDSTIPVTMDEMIYHSKCVRRGSSKFIVADMPFMSYQSSDRDGIMNAGRFLKEAGANAVKIEGGFSTAPLIRRITDAAIPVMGHIGLQPQSVNMTGGYKVQGRNPKDADRIIEEAKILEEAGVFSIVVELVIEEVAKRVSESVNIPVIGIGAGRYTDGQVLVINDMLGADSSYQRKYLKKYADLEGIVLGALDEYSSDVKENKFPAEENSFI